MTPSCLLRGLLYSVLVLVFWGCVDHRIPAVSPGSGTDHLRIKTITQDMPENKATVSSFSYDAQGRLSMIITFRTPDSLIAPVEKTTFDYNAQNRLTQVRREIVRRAGTVPNPYELYVYSYNAAGQVAELNYSNNTGDNHWVVKPLYDTDNRIVGNTKRYVTSGILYDETSTYTFTGNNLTFATTTGILSRNTTFPPVITNTIFTFDTNVNPFYGAFTIPAPFMGGLASPQSGDFSYYTYYGGLNNLFNLSQNNVLSAGSTTYTYTYDSVNLPTSRITTTSSGIIETLRYGYETY